MNTSQPLSPSTADSPTCPLEHDDTLVTLLQIRRAIDRLLAQRKAERSRKGAVSPAPLLQALRKAELDLSPDHPFDTVVTTVADFYHIPPALAWGTTRDRKAAWPRQVAMTLCCEFFPHLPTTTISKAFQRDHSTLSYARRLVLAAQKNPHTRADLSRLRKLIHPKLSNRTDETPSA